MVKFLVQGSAVEPYRVTADGAGPSLKMFCSCPAGRKGGNPCKHIKALVEGREDVLVEPSDSLADLAAAVRGSPYIEWAAGYEPKSERGRVLQCQTMEDALAIYGRRLEEAGWRIEFTEARGDFPSKALAVFGSFKNGKPRKTPTVQLEWSQFTWDAVATSATELTRANVRPRQRPFSVRGNGETVTFGSIERAMFEFLQRIGLSA